MSWENVIIGYKIKIFNRDDIIPIDAKFLESFTQRVTMPSLVDNGIVAQRFRFLVPVYKKKNIKRK